MAWRKCSYGNFLWPLKTGFSVCRNFPPKELFFKMISILIGFYFSKIVEKHLTLIFCVPLWT